MDEYKSDGYDKPPEQDFTLFIGTWNMQKCKTPKNIESFILPSNKRCDVYVIGVQEATNDLLLWENCILNVLGEEFMMSLTCKHGVLHISLFVKKKFQIHTNCSVKEKMSTRAFHKVKTKGAIGVQLDVCGSKFLFLNSHFHSGQNNIASRITNYLNIASVLKIEENHASNNILNSEFFDAIFWFGDLNFRISQPSTLLKESIQDNTYDIREFVKCDQLTNYMRLGRCFPGYKEGKITFLPTYKFQKNTSNYDNIVERVPSYTDRILYRSSDTSIVESYSYNSVPSIKCSDHKPVFAMFKVKIKPYCDQAKKLTEKRVERKNISGFHSKSTVCSIL